jgi:ligand-binding sensor domain-containing protein
MRMNNEASHNIQYLNIEQGLPLPNVRKILQDSRGFFWLGFNGRGLCRYDGRFFVWYTANEGYRGMGVLDMLEDRKGNVWIISEFEIYRYDGKNFYRYYSPISPGANSLTESEDESIWFGNIRGFVKYDGATWTEYGVNEGLPLHNVTSIMEDHSGNIWASGDSGLFIFDGRSITRFFGCGKGMLNNPVFAMVQDKDENIWFGTERGAVKYDGNTFYRYLQRESLTNSKITSIIEDSRGHIWFGSWGDGLIEFDGKSFIHYISTNGMSNYINSLIEDSEHNL